MSEKNVINFYSTKDAYGCFSNFAAYPFRIDNKVWRTSEHYFQAQKFAGTEHEEELRLVESPMVVARMGRDRKRPLRKDWEIVKDDIMREALRAKFTQHDELKKILLETGDARLVEHTANDNYWGDGGDGRGRNMLGQLLMELREQLKEEQ
jgi:N-glycosidase YbiA